MKLPFAILVSLGWASLATACTLPSSPVLVGRWEARETSKGGIGAVVDFRPDGSFVQSLSVLVNLRYATDGDKLTASDHPGGPPSPATATSFRVDRDKLIIGDPAKPTVEATRVGSPEPGAPLIVGAWRYRHYTGGMSYDRYTADGR